MSYDFKEEFDYDAEFVRLKKEFRIEHFQLAFELQKSHPHRADQVIEEMVRERLGQQSKELFAPSGTFINELIRTLGSDYLSSVQNYKSKPLYHFLKEVLPNKVAAYYRDVRDMELQVGHFPEFLQWNVMRYVQIIAQLIAISESLNQRLLPREHGATATLTDSKGDLPTAENTMSKNQAVAHPLRKFQVFVSATSTDLKRQRKAVIEAILKLDHIPCSMEYFTSSDEAQMDYIKKMIDLCDYYVVIVAGKYGSVHDDGISYTQHEYQYAKSIGIPIIALVYDDIDSLANRFVEQTEEMRSKLNAFRAELRRGRMCQSYHTLATLVLNVTSSLNYAVKTFPRPGWIRGTSSTITAVSTPASGVSNDVDGSAKDGIPVNVTADDSEIPVYAYFTQPGRDGKRMYNTVKLKWAEILYSVLPLFDAQRVVVSRAATEIAGELSEFLLKRKGLAAKYRTVQVQHDETGINVEHTLEAQGYIRRIGNNAVTLYKLTEMGRAKLTSLRTFATS